MSSAMIDGTRLPENAAMAGDNAVQSTTEDAASSKLSAVRLGYFKDDYLQNFVRRPTRRSPLINRGYYARVAGMRKVIDEFIQCIPEGTTFQIANLGAGLDTLFYYVNEKNIPFVFYEVDFAEVAMRKAQTIMRKDACWQAISPNKENVRVEGGLIKSDKFKMVACDMRMTFDLEQSLQAEGFRTDLPTLFICECVLVYMQAMHSDAIIRWAAGAVPHAPSAMVIYEQCNPHDAFGRTMIRNLETRGCPLLSIHDYPTIESQKNRYTNFGWQRTTAADMNAVYDLHIDRADVMRIQRLELFDEIEEWRLIQSHYLILVALKGPHDSPDLSFLEPLAGVWSHPHGPPIPVRFFGREAGPGGPGLANGIPAGPNSLY